MSQILEFPGRLPGAAPAEFAAAFLRAIEDDERRRTNFIGGQGVAALMRLSRVDSPFVLGRCGISVFTEILQAAPATGVAFIRTLTERACALKMVIPTSRLSLWERRAGLWRRSAMAGRADAHHRRCCPRHYWRWSIGRIADLTTARRLKLVIGDVIGEGPILGAFWLVIVDLVLSHSSLNGAILRDLLASPETWR